MTNPFDSPLTSVSALYRHTSSRSSLAERAGSALLGESKCTSKNNLTARSTVWTTLKQHVHVQHVPVISSPHSFTCADIMRETYGNMRQVSLKTNNKVLTGSCFQDDASHLRRLTVAFSLLVQDLTRLEQGRSHTVLR